MDFGVSYNARFDSDSDSDSDSIATVISTSSLEDSNESDEGHVMNREELQLLTVAQLRIKLKAVGLKVSGKKDVLIDRLLNPNLHRKKPQDWRKSKAKALLKKLLQNKESDIHNMTPRQIYKSHAWYQEYPFERFKDNLATLQHDVKSNWSLVEEDIKIVREELKNFPQANQSCRGYPRWDKHPAKLLLRQDIKDGKYELGTAKEFQETRDEYRDFPPSVFRSHIHQERRRQREMPMKVVQRNKKAREKHEQDVNEQEQFWAADERYRKEVEDIVGLMEEF
eukprot:scaffold23650_cov205-Skeletonema_marinoi.AAC.2